MQLHVNGESLVVEPNTTLNGLLETLGLSKQRLAVELNEEILSRNKFSETVLSAGDRIEIVRAIGGG